MEQVVLLDDVGSAIGTCDKSAVHTADTALHLAFSSYVVDNDGHVLVTQRASTKRTWPGVWTNSCCGHPAPGEVLSEALVRRLDEELGVVPASTTLVLPDFRYRAVMDNGIVENEMCPVFRVVVDHRKVRHDPAEVDDMRWEPWSSFAANVITGAHDVSPWCREQVVRLQVLGDDPHAWRAADPSELPPAARSN